MSLKFRGRRSGRVVSALNAGFAATVNLGTDGDFFIAPAPLGNDLNPGTSAAAPIETVTKLRTLSIAGKTIRVMPGTHRQAFDLTDKGGSASAPTRLLVYGNAGDATISGANQWTSGWTLCTSPTDDPELGADLAGSGKVWKRTGVAISTFVDSKPLSANLFQNSVKLNLATAKAVRSIYADVDLYTPNWLVSPNVTLSGSTIVSYELPDDLKGRGFTSGQFTDVTVLQAVDGNVTFANTVASFASDTVTVTTAQTYENGGAYDDSFALQNFLPEMRKGEWGYRITGGGSTVTVYIWPHNDADGSNMTIDYSARGYGVKMGGSGCNASLNSYLEIGGLIIERQSSAATENALDGNCAISAGGIPTAGSGVSGSNQRTNISIHDCLIRDTWRADRAQGQVWIQYANSVTFQRNTVRKAINSFGCFFQGEPWYDAQSNGLRFMDNIIEECTNSGVRLMAQKNVVIARNRLINFGIATHSNQLNPYVISKDVVLYGNIFQGGTGYITWGDSNPPDMLFNYVDSSHTLATPTTVDGRAMVDQNNQDPHASLTQGMTKAAWIAARGAFVNPTAPPCWFDNTPVTALIACNQIAPNSENNSSFYKGLAIGTSDPAARAAYLTYYDYKVVNNVLNGITWGSGTAPNGDGWVDACLSNLSTKGTSNGITGLTSVDSSNKQVVVSAEYTDITTNDWSAPVTATRRTKSGITTQSIAADIAALKLRFPDVESIFDYDCCGRVYDKTNPPVGPFTNVDDLPAYAPMFWTPPELGGSILVGAAATVSTPVMAGYPKPTVTRQWKLRTDPLDSGTASTISGATSATSPTWVADDIGDYPAVDVIATNSAGALTAPVVSADPVV